MEEQTDRTMPKDELQIRLLTENITALTYTVQMQNAVILALVQNVKDQHGFKVPDWKDKEEVEKELGDILEKCAKKVDELYGQRKTNKS